MQNRFPVGFQQTGHDQDYAIVSNVPGQQWHVLGKPGEVTGVFGRFTIHATFSPRNFPSPISKGVSQSCLNIFRSKETPEKVSYLASSPIMSPWSLWPRVDAPRNVRQAKPIHKYPEA